MLQVGVLMGASQAIKLVLSVEFSRLRALE